MLLFTNLIIKFYWKKYLISLNVGVPSTTLDHIRRQKCKNDLSNSLESEICLISLEIEIIFFCCGEWYMFEMMSKIIPSLLFSFQHPEAIFFLIENFLLLLFFNQEKPLHYFELQFQLYKSFLKMLCEFSFFFRKVCDQKKFFIDCLKMLI